jgi:DNA-binding NarL/FixJ family response regulator
LSEREYEILELITQGNSNTTIANRLSLSVETVQKYGSNILNKLPVADRFEAISRAKEQGVG